MVPGQTPQHQSNSRRGQLGPVVAGVLGAVIALVLLPATSHELGPAVIELSGTPGSGRTVLEVTPFGTVDARTHMAPLDVTAALRRVDVEALGATITTPGGRAALEAEVEAQIGDLLRKAFAKEVVAAALVGALLGAALFRHRRRAGAIAATTAGGLVALSLLLTMQTFQQDRFANARYTGSLARARQVIETLTEHTETLDEARTRYEVAARRVSELMILLARPDSDVATDTTSILHISDVHANPVGLEIAAELAREFDVAAVVDTGDLASSVLDTGEIVRLAQPLDRLMVDLIENVEVPYLFVPGNHDSPQLRRAVGRADNATVVHDETVPIAGIDILGWADPTYSTEPIPESEKSETRATFSDEVRVAVARDQPDVVAVHDAVLAREAVGSVPLVISGHLHRRVVEERDGTRLLTVGSAGATGVETLTVEADLLYEAEVLHFEGDTLVAVDYLTLRGLGDDFTLERTTFESITEG